MRSETCRKGEIAKYKIILRAYELGIVVNIPTIDCDYDIILDDGGLLTRVQIKYTNCKRSNVSGSICLNLRRTTRNKKVICYSENDVDAMLIYLPVIDEIVWLKPEIWNNKTSITIRYAAPKKEKCYRNRLLMAQDHIW